MLRLHRRDGHGRAARPSRPPPAHLGLRVDPAHVAVTTGSSGRLHGALPAAFDPRRCGDDDASGRPTATRWPRWGCRPSNSECGPVVRFQPTVALCSRWTAAAGAPPAGLIIASPRPIRPARSSRPTSSPRSRWCDANDVLLVSDEIYHGVTFGEQAASARETSRESHARGFGEQVLLDDRVAGRVAGAAGAPGCGRSSCCSATSTSALRRSPGLAAAAARLDGATRLDGRAALPRQP